MITHIARFTYEGTIRWGIVKGEAVQLLVDNYDTTEALLNDRSNIEHQAKSNDGDHITMNDVALLSPITKPCRVICQGANYRQHMIESGMDPDAKAFNMFFNKSSASVCGSNDNIVKPAHVSLLDYEVELGLVMGKAITENTQVNKSNLHEYVAAVVIGNDVSARDVQIPETQFFKGKSYRTFCPVGPFLALLNENNIHYLNALNLELKVNGEVRQSDNSANLVFKPSETLTELSTFSDLAVGDLVLTGTPSGCALRIPSPLIVKLFSLLPESMRWKMFKKIQGKRPQYLNVGDKIQTRIFSDDKLVDLGTQKNTITG